MTPPSPDEQFRAEYGFSPDATPEHGVRSDQVAWLIERSVTGRPIWWSGFGLDAWTRNANGAVRFQRRSDAEQVIEGFRLAGKYTQAFASEHLWTTGNKESHS